MPLECVFQVIGALALGGFVGLDRRLAGARLAIPAHAVVSTLGLASVLAVAGVLFDSEGGTLVIAGLLAIAALLLALNAGGGGGIRAMLRGNGDAMSFGCAFCVGVACGTGFERAVVLSLLLTVAVSIFRPRGRLNIAEAAPIATFPCVSLSAAAATVGDNLLVGSATEASIVTPATPLAAGGGGPGSRQRRAQFAVRDPRVIRGYALRHHRAMRRIAI